MVFVFLTPLIAKQAAHEQVFSIAKGMYDTSRSWQRVAVMVALVWTLNRYIK